MAIHKEIQSSGSHVHPTGQPNSTSFVFLLAFKTKEEKRKAIYKTWKKNIARTEMRSRIVKRPGEKGILRGPTTL